MRLIIRFRGTVAFLLTAGAVLVMAAMTSAVTVGWIGLAVLMGGVVATAVAEGGPGSGRERRARPYPQEESGAGG